MPAREEAEGRTYRHTWTGLLQSETGDSVSMPGAADRTVQAIGTFGGTSIAFQGSLEKTPTNWFPLTDLQGNAITFTSAGGELVTEMTTHIRPVLTGGDGSTTITVTMLSRSTMS
jgi:hypothetical protein